MFLHRILALAWLAVSIPISQAADSKLNGWYPCSELTFADEITSKTSTKTAAPSTASDGQIKAFMVGAECATFSAPLCYEDVCPSSNSSSNSTQNIDIFVKRIVATDKPETRPNVWFLQGGPGAGSTNMESAMKGLHDMLNGQVNVYTMDHRGTGRSTILDCVAAQAQTSGSPAGSSIATSEIASCADELQQRYGGNLAGFSITSAAWDLHNFITTYQKDASTFVYGVSYGSSVVERLMHLNPPGVVGYVLDGISTTSGSDKSNFEYFSTWDVDYNAVGEYFMSLCDQDKDNCGKYFKDASLSATLKTLIMQLDAGTATCSNVLATIFSNVAGADTDEIGLYARILIGKLLSNPSLRNFIAPVVYRIKRCNSQDAKILNHFFNTLVTLMGPTTEDDLFSSTLLYKLIVYSELWEIPTPSLSTLTKRFTNATLSSGMMSMLPGYCAFSKDTATACYSYAKYASYKANAIIYKRDAYWNVAAKIPTGKSVLLLSSKTDPQTPHKFAEFLLAALKADNKELITFDHATHGQLWNTPIVKSDKTCGMTIFASYIKNGGDLSKLDKSCLPNVEPLTFKPKSKLVGRLFNATDAWDGKYDPSTQPIDTTGSSSAPSSGSGYKTGMIILIIVCVVVAAVGVAFFFKWRQAHENKNAMVAVATPTPSSP